MFFSSKTNKNIKKNFALETIYPYIRKYYIQKLKMILFEGKNIAKNYPNSHFQLSVPELVLDKNSITGVVGENGNGKTTLLNIVAGELGGDGTLQYFGETVSGQTKWLSIKDHIGFIPQRIPRWYGTLEENLYLRAALCGTAAPDIEKEVNEMLDFLNLQTYRKLHWIEISTGYRLRFELARILLGKPKLLVLDEPLANLDINTQQKFLSDLRDLVHLRTEDIAIIISSQQLHEIESVASQMLFLKEGKMVFGGSSDKIAGDSNSHISELIFAENNREKALEYFEKNEMLISKRGSYIQIESALPPKKILQDLLNEDLVPTYYRDLTHSTKRFFN